MTRISKNPDIRRQELIDAAERMFLERGYDTVSVGDILKEVGGANGMFYYYFKTKKDIYKEAMAQFIDKTVTAKTAILQDKSIPIPVRFEKVINYIASGFQQYLSAFDTEENKPYETRVFMRMLNLLSDPVAAVILEAKEQSIARAPAISENNARSLAIFILHGIYGLLHDKRKSESVNTGIDRNMAVIIPFISMLLDISPALFSSMNQTDNNK